MDGLAQCAHYPREIDPTVETGKMLDIKFEPLPSLPRGGDLPNEDGIPMDSEIHREQASKYLIEPLKRWLREQKIEAFVGGNSFVYFPPSASVTKTVRTKPKRLGPDVYVVMGGQSRGQKKWVVWEESGLYPTLAIELLSPSTEAKDRGSKFVIYRDQWKMPDYFLFESDSATLEGFCLRRKNYLSTQADQQGLHSCSSIPLKLGIRDGWVRWFSLDGQVLPTDQELAEQERQRAEQEHQRAEQEHQRAEQEHQLAAQEKARADRLAVRLRELGIEE